MRRRPWSRFCSQKKRKKRKLCLAKHDYVYLFCAFLCPRENGALSISSLERMAGTTRLELATSAVTGQRSNQLNYVPTNIWQILCTQASAQCNPRFCHKLFAAFRSTTLTSIACQLLSRNPRKSATESVAGPAIPGNSLSQIASRLFFFRLLDQ